jgi:putative ABC transport system permease protein
MGKAFLIARLALKDIRHRPAQSILLLLAIATGAATLSLALALGGTTADPYERTRAATNGPDIVAQVAPDSTRGSGPPQPVPGGGGQAQSDVADPSALVPLEHVSGVVASSGPFPMTWAPLELASGPASAEVQGRDSATSPVDEPQLLEGTWVRPGGVVVEAGFASALGIHVGDPLSLGDSSYRVVGIAVTAATPAYPTVCKYLGCFLVGKIGSYDPGLVWAPSADVGHLAAASSEPVFYLLNLRLGNPADAQAFAERFNASASPTDPTLFAWQGIRDANADVVAKVQTVLVTGSVLLDLLAIASVVVLVGARMAEQTRRVGLIKAVGGTPTLVALMLLFEHVVVALCGAAVGLLVGWLTAPLVDAPGAGLLGAPTVPPLTGFTVGLVVVVALAVALAATFVPAVRAARQSTVAALEGAARAPRRRAAVVRLSAQLPVSLLVGVRLVVRRPRRLFVSVLSVAVTMSGLVAVLILNTPPSGQPGSGELAVGSLGPRVVQALAIVSVLLVLLAAVNAVVIAWATALDVRRPAALIRTLGATPMQVTGGLSVAQLLPALIGALLGIIGGVGIYARGGLAPTLPPLPWLLALVIGALLTITILTAAATWIASRRTVAELLKSDSA